MRCRKIHGKLYHRTKYKKYPKENHQRIYHSIQIRQISTSRLRKIMTIDFQCYYCGQPLQTSTVAIGFTMSCPCCSHRIKIPTHPDSRKPIYVDHRSIIGSEVTEKQKYKPFQFSKPGSTSVTSNYEWDVEDD